MKTLLIIASAICGAVIWAILLSLLFSGTAEASGPVPGTTDRCLTQDGPGCRGVRENECRDLQERRGGRYDPLWETLGCTFKGGGGNIPETTNTDPKEPVEPTCRGKCGGHPQGEPVKETPKAGNPGNHKPVGEAGEKPNGKPGWGGGARGQSERHGQHGRAHGRH